MEMEIETEVTMEIEIVKDYAKLDRDALERLLLLKDRTNKLLQGRLDEAKAVIDAVAKYVEIDDKGYYLYGVYEDGSTPITNEIKRYFDDGGDKVKLKKRIAELENENSVLRSILGK